MAGKRRRPPGMVGRLAERGEEAISRMSEDVRKSARVTDALHRAMEAKGKLDAGTRRALGQMGIAQAEELKELRKTVERMEKRLAKLEAAAKAAPRRAAARRAASPRPQRARGAS